MAIGNYTATQSQGTLAIAIAIGIEAGRNNQGTAAIAIGARAGLASQAANSIVINATNIQLDNVVANTLIVKPVRENTTGTAPTSTLPTGFFYTIYNPTTGEMGYWNL